MGDHDLKDLRGRIEKALTLVESRQDNISALQHEEEQKYLALRRQHRRKMIAWKQRLDALEEQHEQLTLGVGAASRGRAPRNLDQLTGILEEVLQNGAERRNGAVAGRKGSVNPLEGHMRGPANGHAQSDGSDDEYSSPSEEDMDEDGDEEGEDGEDEGPAPAPQPPPQMVPRQVALRQQRPAGAAPPGFERQSAGSPDAPVPPPGFEGKAALQSPPGYPRATTGSARVSPAKEPRGAADMRPADLRSLLSRRREGSSPQLSHTPRTDVSDGDAPAPAVPDAREIINMRKRESQEPPAPRQVREWDAGKETPQDNAPGERPARPARPGVPLYQPRPRDRTSDAAPPPPPPPPPPPGFSAGREPPQPVSAARAPSGWSDDGFKAPSSPMVDPEEGSRDRAYFSSGPAHSEGASSSTLQDQLFPSLGGAASKGVDAEGASPSSAAAAPQLQGAWGSGSIATRLAQVQKDPASVSSPAPGSQDMVAYEQRAGLRPKYDAAPDKERRQQMRSKKDFVHVEDVRTGPGWQRGPTNVVEGLELHKNLLSPAEQDIFIQAIKDWEAQGRRNELRGRTFSAPRKSMRGKGRVTIQFGCCYNYAVDREGRQPGNLKRYCLAGIIPEEVVEPMPDLLVALVKRLVRWGVLPAKMAPDTAIINIYDEIDCIPPHIDHHDFSRPFCTISLLSEQQIMFGHKLIPLSAGHFVGATCDAYLLPLPVGSCLVLKGNGADVAMHCVPPVSAKRMSITLRRMGPQYADQVRKQGERAAQLVQRLPRSWADDVVEEAPRRYGADDWEEAEGDNDNRLQRF